VRCATLASCCFDPCALQTRSGGLPVLPTGLPQSRRILLLAFGENKAAAAAAAVEGPVTPKLPASFLQSHPDAVALLDYAAAAKLTRVASPWQLGPVRWDEAQVKKAACWLSHKVRPRMRGLSS
jgi:hypothetical protein